MGYLFGTFFGVSFPSPPLLHVLVFFGFSTLLSIGFLLPAVYVCVCQQRLLVYLLWWSISSRLQGSLVSTFVSIT